MMRIRTSYFLILAMSAAITAGCSSSSYPSAPSQPSGGGNGGNAMNVSIVRGADTLTTTAFAPNPDTIAVGASLTWINSDTIAHTTTADGGAWNSGSIAPGGTFSHAFPTAGTFTYHCAIHPGMAGTVVVQ